MQQPSFDDNPYFRLAADFINHTSRHVFLTGNAGTGKTTFLKYIRGKTSKNVAVVAPTGVAAINAQGVTIHSFFQLPFAPFIPNKTSLLNNSKINKSKIGMFRELELLIIDEVSMVRCDVLDAIDTTLRHFRREPHLPFGGIQVLYIGDLFQLPPVVPSDQWEMLSPYYNSPFFFDAQVIQHHKPLYIELKKIYRQKDQAFIDILNRVRRNETLEADFRVLNEKHEPTFLQSDHKNAVVLSTHNASANAINEKSLRELPGKAFRFSGTVEGDFPDKIYPTDAELQLKEGAQVMFIRNDPQQERNYYNGKIAVVKSLSEDSVKVTFQDGTEFEVGRETWQNITYTLTDENKIEDNILGTFTQFPLRLAWAITIHKSQGLTLEKAVIDAGRSFAAGQVYVALSRCTSLDGLTLLSRIHSGCISTDPRVIEFSSEELGTDALQPLLQQEKSRYFAESLLKIFSFVRLSEHLDAFHESLKRRKLADKKAAYHLVTVLRQENVELEKVSVKFRQQLDSLIIKKDFELLKKRINDALAYFSDTLETKSIVPLMAYRNEIKKQKKAKKYLNVLGELSDQYSMKIKEMQKAGGLAEGIA